MQHLPANPLILALLFIARCLIPVGILLGLSYLVRRLGLIQESPLPAAEADKAEAPDEGLLDDQP